MPPSIVSPRETITRPNDWFLVHRVRAYATSSWRVDKIHNDIILLSNLKKLVGSRFYRISCTRVGGFHGRIVYNLSSVQIFPNKVRTASKLCASR